MEALLGEIKKAHTDAGKKYPRPTIPCGCGVDKKICWNKFGIISLRHESKSENCGKNLDSVSEEHNLAQMLLLDYLNNNLGVNFFKECNCCDNINISNKKLKYVKEYTHKFNDKICRYDIAGLNDDNIPLFGIEIYHTHRAEQTEVRNSLPWVEINASDIINELNIDPQPMEIELDDILCLDDNDNNSMDELTNDIQKVEFSSERTCYGNCLMRINYNNNKMTSYKRMHKCKYNCAPIKCSSCKIYLPQWVTFCYNGTCLNCDIKNSKLCNSKLREKTTKKLTDSMNVYTRSYNSKLGKKSTNRECENCGKNNIKDTAPEYYRKCFTCYRNS